MPRRTRVNPANLMPVLDNLPRSMRDIEESGQELLDTMDQFEGEDEDGVYDPLFQDIGDR